MSNARVRLRLQNRITNKIIFVYVFLYNENNGLMNFPVDLIEWELLSIDRGIGLRDINNTEIFENDKVLFSKIDDTENYIEGFIVYNNQSACFKIQVENITFSCGSFSKYIDFTQVKEYEKEVIGNKYNL